jgi:hypothetical protein
MKKLIKKWLGITDLETKVDNHRECAIRNNPLVIKHDLNKDIAELQNEIDEIKKVIPRQKSILPPELDRLNEWSGKLDDTTVSALFKFPFKAEKKALPKRKYVKSGKYSKKGTNNGK